jgi:hypothetical protein
MNLSRIRSLIRVGMARDFKDSGHLHGSIYTDEELDELINEAYTTFCHESGILNAKKVISITDNVGALDPNIEVIKRVEVDGTPIKSISPEAVSEELMP